MKSPDEARLALADALESGEYIQGKSSLCSKVDNIERHCCLGVACREYIRDGGELLVEVSSAEYFYYFNDKVGALPETVRKWLGFRTPIGALKKGGSLADKNDAGSSFVEIATIIRNDEVLLSEDAN